MYRYIDLDILLSITYNSRAAAYLKVTTPWFSILITKVRNLTIFNYYQKIDILVIINQCKTNSI